jgi:hypothetical protein
MWQCSLYWNMWGKGGEQRRSARGERGKEGGRWNKIERGELTSERKVLYSSSGLPECQ